MRHVDKHWKPAAEIFEHYLDALDRGDTLTFEKDLRTWMDKAKSNLIFLELRRIWYRIIDGDLEGAKTMVLELQEQHLDRCEVENSILLRFYDRRLDEKGF
jgi:hypothetical protein